MKIQGAAQTTSHLRDEPESLTGVNPFGDVEDRLCHREDVTVVVPQGNMESAHTCSCEGSAGIQSRDRHDKCPVGSARNIRAMCRQ